MFAALAQVREGVAEHVKAKTYQELKMVAPLEEEPGLKGLEPGKTWSAKQSWSLVQFSHIRHGYFDSHMMEERKVFEVLYDFDGKDSAEISNVQSGEIVIAQRLRRPASSRCISCPCSSR